LEKAARLLADLERGWHFPGGRTDLGVKLAAAGGKTADTQSAFPTKRDREEAGCNCSVSACVRVHPRNLRCVADAGVAERCAEAVPGIIRAVTCLGYEGPAVYECNPTRTVESPRDQADRGTRGRRTRQQCRHCHSSEHSHQTAKPMTHTNPPI